MKLKNTFYSILFCVFFVFSMWTGSVFASSTLGTISSSAKYAWSDQIGWVNFAPTDSSAGYVGAVVSDTTVTGYAWSQTMGWINLNPANGGVLNNSAGTLSGDAWGENFGWIDFSGVTINNAGVFSGTATGDVIGTLTFSCSNCSVTTDWRPASTRTTTTTGGGGGHGGGGGTPTPTPPPPPTPTPTPTPTPGPTPSPSPGPGPTPSPAPSPSPTPNPSPAPAPGPGPGPSPSAPAGPGIGQVFNGAGQFIKDQVAVISGNVKIAADEVKKIVNTPEISVATKVVSTVGAAVGAAAVVSVFIFSPASLFELFLLPFRLFALLFGFFVLKRRWVPWGIVYDSVTKQPIDPAYVVLKDLQGKTVATTITDVDGRFGFLVPPGMYLIAASKTNYSFPSKKLIGKTNDELYANLYGGQVIEIKKEGEVISKNIPMDPLKFDWNEFAKKDKSFMKFYSHWDSRIRKISDSFFVVGFVIAIVAFFAAPRPYNTIILSLYLVLLLVRVVGVKLKSFGYAISKTTGVPLSFAIVRVFLPGSNIEIAHKICDQFGRYYCLVPKGKYYVKIEAKNPDESYSVAYTSGIIDATKKGIIKEKFEVE